MFIKVKILFVFDIMTIFFSTFVFRENSPSNDEHCSMKNSRVSSRAQIRSFAVFITLRCGESKKWNMAAKKCARFLSFYFLYDDSESFIHSEMYALCKKNCKAIFNTIQNLLSLIFFPAGTERFHPRLFASIQSPARAISTLC